MQHNAIINVLSLESVWWGHNSILQYDLDAEMNHFVLQYGNWITEVSRSLVLVYDPAAEYKFVKQWNIKFTLSRATEKINFRMLMFHELELCLLSIAGSFEKKIECNWKMLLWMKNESSWFNKHWKRVKRERGCF